VAHVNIALVADTQAQMMDDLDRLTKMRTTVLGR
jgi:hypothetical protein